MHQKAVISPERLSARPRDRGADVARGDARRLARKITDELGVAIAKGEYLSGEPLTGSVVAQRFGVSRGLACEAINSLVRRRLARRDDHRRALVVGLSLETFIDLFNSRALLLALATRHFARAGTAVDKSSLRAAVVDLARYAEAAQCDPIKFAESTGALGRLIYRNCGSPALSKLISHQVDGSAWGTLWRQVPLDYTGLARRREAATIYGEISDAIQRRDANAAERLMRSALMRSRAAAVASLSQAKLSAADDRKALMRA